MSYLVHRSMEALDDQPELTRDEAREAFDSLTHDCFEHLERCLELATDDLAVDVATARETTATVQGKLASIVDELVCRSRAPVADLLTRRSQTFLARFPSRFETFERLFHRAASLANIAPSEYNLAHYFAHASAGVHTCALDRFHQWRVEDAEKSAANLALLASVFRHLSQPPVSWEPRLDALRTSMETRHDLARRERAAFLHDHPELQAAPSDG